MPLFTGNRLGFGKDAAGGASAPEGISATGGDTVATFTDGEDKYKYHVFTSS